MHEVMMELEKIKGIKKTLMCWLESETAKGQECFDVEAAGQVADMIKDLAEASEKCVKAKYYETVTKAMEEYSDDEEGSERYGYDNYRYSSGRFAPKGHGHRSGYIPAPPYADSRMPWPMTGHMQNDRDGVIDSHDGMNRPMDDQNGRMGYIPMREYPDFADRNPNGMGAMYDEYKMAKRHYTETKDEGHKKHMHESIEGGVMEALEAIEEMWKDASPELKKKLKPAANNLFDTVMKA